VSTDVLGPAAGDDVGTGAPGRRWSPSRPSGFRWPWGSRPRRELTAFLAVALLVLGAVSAGTVLISERIARANALAEAERTATRLGQLLIAPLLTDYLRGVPGAFEDLDRIVGYRMSDGSVTAMVIWTADGTVLYASHEEIIGESYSPSPELLTAVGGTVVANVDEEPETAYQGVAPGPMVEVYTPLTANGQSLAFEAYFSYDRIEREATLLRWQIIPMAIGALVALQLVQVPIATSLARRVRRHEAERAELMERALTNSDRERRAVAADLHDGPVQDLAGVSYALGALRMNAPTEQHAAVDRLVGAVRHAVQSLRKLMVDIYPPDLSGPGLGVAVGDLVEPLHAQGLTISLDTGPLPDLSPDTAAAVYRTAREALANVATHARARSVWVRLEETQHERRPAVLLEVADDGVGFPDTGIDRRSEGHLGLRLVLDRVAHLGGRVDIGRRPGGGAVVTAVLPAHHVP
jgi:two-component system NarL family sensor kinase